MRFAALPSVILIRPANKGREWLLSSGLLCFWIDIRGFLPHLRIALDCLVVIQLYNSETVNSEAEGFYEIIGVCEAAGSLVGQQKCV
jgi:hypothetical protein